MSLRNWHFLQMMALACTPSAWWQRWTPLSPRNWALPPSPCAWTTPRQGPAAAKVSVCVLMCVRASLVVFLARLVWSPALSRTLMQKQNL
eukprot:1158821-Pelagomonas_calceolata.AAC.6